MKQYTTPSFWIGLVVAVVVSLGAALSVYDGNTETVAPATIATVAITAIVRAVFTYFLSRVSGGQ